MVYTKPQILDTLRAQEYIKGSDKSTDIEDHGQMFVQGTPTAYESDE
jgi:hypothetical protein